MQRDRVWKARHVILRKLADRHTPCAFSTEVSEEGTTHEVEFGAGDWRRITLAWNCRNINAKLGTLFVSSFPKACR
jgi:hypothetical protein